MNRRNIIRAGLSALAAGLLLKFVGANSVTVDRVEGANGASIIIGQSNTGSSTTTLSSPVTGPTAFFDNNGGTGDAQAIQGRITGTSGRAFVGFASAGSGSTIALDGVCNSLSGIALRGANTSTGLGLKASSKGAFIGQFQNNGLGTDKTALISWVTGDASPFTWNVGVGGAGNGLGLTLGDLYFEFLGHNFLAVTHDGRLLPDVGNFWVLGKSSTNTWLNIWLQTMQIIGESGFTYIIPNTDNTGSIGTASNRWNLIRGVTITSGDLVFENGLRVTEHDTNGLAFVDTNNEKFAVLDKDGNLQIKGTLTEHQKVLGQANPVNIKEQQAQGKPR